ncbi:hypothetical protein IQ266_09950 [filamentous cyanobacterium LEGE 11480]|uniref:Uncharacterized protein n=1 Tax=Romeriopsis navalis LEGE 11480 TaxID=2777977 RepID=A0A928Z2Y1_9CYAN|nr:hypothetical protein [Romeriopsis navalis]MBE9030049.1 hypothetical protein [Romeriopsis navalis LEGE 11480]
MLSITEIAITYAAKFVLLFSFIYFPAAFILIFVKSIRDPQPHDSAPELPTDTVPKNIPDRLSPSAERSAEIPQSSYPVSDADNPLGPNPWQENEVKSKPESNTGVNLKNDVPDPKLEAETISSSKSNLESELSHKQPDERKAAELLTAINQIDDHTSDKNNQKKRTIELAGSHVRIYRYHQHDVVLVKDLPFSVPPQTKQYRLRKRPAIELAIAQTLAQAAPPK